MNHQHQHHISHESPPACHPTVPPNLPDAAKPVVETGMSERTAIHVNYNVAGGCYPGHCPSPINQQPQ